MKAQPSEQPRSLAEKLQHLFASVKPAGRGGSRNAHEIHDYLVGRKVVLRVVRILGLGHAWSGGDPAHAFNAKAGPDASRMVLDFLGRHRR